MQRYHPLAAALRRTFKCPVRKISLDAGSGCPNRDGTLSTQGCAFCNEKGSGTGRAALGLGLAEQWNERRAALAARHPTWGLLAYIQSFSNTYGPLKRLAGILGEVRTLPGVAGLCLGTRPDCLDEAKADLLAAVPLPWVQVDLGLQSSDPATLARVNRGHGPGDFAQSCRLLAARGVRVCAHVMAGLPGEGCEGFLATVDFLNGLPVSGVKLHNTLVLSGTALAREYEAARYAPPSLDEYARWAALAVARLRPDVSIDRLCADPAPGELLAPAWAADKRAVLAAVQRFMEEQDLWQGKHAPRPTDKPSPWFDLDWAGSEPRIPEDL